MIKNNSLQHNIKNKETIHSLEKIFDGLCQFRDKQNTRHFLFSIQDDIKDIEGNSEKIFFGIEKLLSELKKTIELLTIRESVNCSEDIVTQLIECVKFMISSLKKTYTHKAAYISEILPHINNLRIYQNTATYAIVDFFDISIPQHKPLQKEQISKLSNTDFQHSFKIIWETYKKSLDLYLEKKKSDIQLRNIVKSLHQAYNITWGTPKSILWEVSTVISECLYENSISRNTQTDNILKYTANKIQEVVLYGPSYLNSPPQEKIIKTAFLALASSESKKPYITQYTEKFHLGDSLNTLTFSQVNTSSKKSKDNIKNISFIKTSENIFTNINRFLSSSTNNILDLETCQYILLEFTSLKETTNKTGNHIISELANSVEKMLHNVVLKKVKPNKKMTFLINEVVKELPNIISEFNEMGQTLTPEILTFMEQADDLAKGELFFEQENSETQNDENPQTEDDTNQHKHDLKENKHFLDAINKVSIDNPTMKTLNEISKIIEEFSFEKKLPIPSPISNLNKILNEVINYMNTHKDYNLRLLEESIKGGFEILIAQSNQFISNLPLIKSHFILNKIKQSLHLLLTQKKNKEIQKSSKKDKSTAQKTNIETKNLQKKLFALNNTCRKTLTQWLKTPSQTSLLEEIQTNLHNLNKYSETIGHEAFGELCQSLISLYLSIEKEKVSSAKTPLSLLQLSHNQIDHIISNLKLQSKDVMSFKESKDATKDKKNHVSYKLLSIFISESSTLVKECEEYFKKWKQDTNDKESIQKLQRALHTIKGGAKMVELNELAHFCHALETIYHTINKGTIQGKRIPITLLNNYHKKIKDIIYTIRDNKINNDEYKMISLFESETSDSYSGQSNNDPSIDRNTQLPDYMGKEKGSFNIKLVNNNQLTLAQKHITSKNNTFANHIHIPRDKIDDIMEFVSETTFKGSLIKQKASQLSNKIDEITVILTKQHKKIETMSKKLKTDLMFVQKNNRSLPSSTFLNFSKSLEESFSDLLFLQKQSKKESNDINELLEQQAHIQSNLKTVLISSSAAEFSYFSDRLRKTVAQVAQELNKSVAFTITGDNTLVDQKILDKLTPSLEHILRNAVAHGIEQDEYKRLEHGKNKKGKISLDISIKGFNLVLKVQDDGVGIDLHKLTEKALEQKIINEHQKLSKNDLLSLVLHPGISTADKITEISGRGIGLDAVNNSIKMLSGHIYIESAPLGGTSFKLYVPNIDSITQALITKQKNNFYAIPINDIKKVTLISYKNLIDQYKKTKSIIYNNISYPIFFLSQLLNNTLPTIEKASYSLILLESDNKHIALCVDEICNNQEVLVKKINTQLSATVGILGGTVLPTGETAVVIDPIGFSRKITNYSQPINTFGNSLTLPTTPTKPVVLVVDDSITVRKITSHFLKKTGYQVYSASDGIKALDWLNNNPRPDLVILDIEMPNIDGFGVARAIRANKKTVNLPIIMISSRTDERHKKLAQNLSIKHYIGKPFQENTLIETVKLLSPVNSPA